MSLLKRVVNGIKERRDRILSGKVNCIPWGFPRFEFFSPGIERGKYYIITANSKVGKSQITDFLFMYNPFRMIKTRKLPIKLKVFYFSLEMAKEEKVRAAISHFLFTNSDFKTIISPKNVNSTRKGIDQSILDEIEKNEEFLTEFLDCVTYIDNIRNPFGIFNFMRNYAKDNGTQHTRTIQTKDGPIEVDDWYEPNDPEEYVVCIVDHAKLLTPEKGHSGVRDAIGKLSSDHFVQIRNKYGHIPVLIQQQSAAQESVENLKAGRLRPTLDGLGENKTTQQDANVILGLFSPFRHLIPDYDGYNIKFFKDNIRFLEILGGREGGAGAVCPLYFNGAVNFFDELPKADDKNLSQYQSNIIKLRENEQ